MHLAVQFLTPIVVGVGLMLDMETGRIANQPLPLREGSSKRKEREA